MITLKRSWLMVMLALATIPASQAEPLDEVVRQTLSSNPDVLERMNARLAVDQEVRQAKAGYYPSVDLNAGIGEEKSDNPSTRAAGYDSRSLNRREAGVTLRQPIYSGGSTMHEVKRQKQRANSSAYTMHATAEQVALRTTEVYLEVLRRQALVWLAQDNLKSHEKVHDQVAARSASGVGRGADLEQARSRLLLAKSNLMAEESNLREAEINYFSVVNVAPFNLVMPVAPAEQVPSTMLDAVQAAVDNHPILKVAAADIEAASEQNRTAKAPFYPTLDFELGANRNNNLAGIEGDNNNTFAMLRMRYNLYAGGRDKARQAQTFHQIGEAKEVRNQTCRQVVESMRLSWNAFKTTDAQVVYLKQRVEASLNARDSYRSQFTLGQRSLLDLLDTENEVFTSSKALTEAEFDRLFAIYRVMAGEGMLLTALGIEPTAEMLPVSNELSEISCNPEVPFQKVPQAVALASSQPPKEVVVERIVPVATPPVVIEKTLPPVLLERVTLESGALFDTARAELKPKGKTELDQLALKLSGIKHIENVEIVGHTDSQGSDEYNRGLSIKRATAVADYLVTRGVARELISVKGMGEDLPVASNRTAEGRAKNRRVEVNIKVTRQVPTDVTEAPVDTQVPADTHDSTSGGHGH